MTGGRLYLGSGGITVQPGGGYDINLGGGTIAAQSSWSSALSMNLTGINGPITFDPSGNVITLSGSLSGSGGLTVAGSGTLELAGANTYTGATLVNQGTLKLDSTNNSTSSIKAADCTTLNLSYIGTMVVPSFYTNNVSLPVGTYNAGNLSAFITGAGSLQVVGSIPTSPTNITFSASGGQLSLSWPAGYLGWILQTQTNSRSVGLNTNWFDVAGSGSMTATNIPVSAATPTVFYRLRTP